MVLERDSRRAKLTVVKNDYVPEKQVGKALRNFKDNNSKQINTKNDVKRVIEENRSKFTLEKNECNIKDLLSAEEVITKSLKGSRPEFQQHLYSLLTEIYCLLEFPELAFYHKNNMAYNYGDKAIPSSTNELILLLKNKVAGSKDLSTEENLQAFLDYSIERLKTFEREGLLHWGAFATVGIAYIKLGDNKNAYKFYSKSQAIISKNFSKLDKSVNTSLLIPEYRQGEVHYHAAVDNDSFNEAYDPDNFSPFDDLHLAENKLLNVYNKGFITHELINYIATICSYKDKYKEALGLYSQSINYNPAYIAPYIDAFYTMMDAGNFKDARFLFKKIAYIFPESDRIKDANEFYKNVIGVEVFAEDNISLITDNISKDEKRKQVINECLDIINNADISMNLVDKRKGNEIIKLTDTAMDLMNDGIKFNSTDKLFEAESLANQVSLLIPSYISIDLVHLNSYYNFGFYGSCIKIFDKIKLHYGNNYNLGENGKNMKLLISAFITNPNPLPFINQAQDMVKNFPDHFASHCNLGYAYRLASYKSDDSATAFEYSKKAYDQYVIAQKKLSLYLTGSEDNFSTIYQSHSNKLSWCMHEPLEGHACTKFDMFALAQIHNVPYNQKLFETNDKLNWLLKKGYGSHDMYYILGYMYESADELEKAVEFFENSFELDENNFVPLIRIAVIYIEMGKTKIASAYFKKAKEIAPNELEILQFEKKYKNILT